MLLRYSTTESLHDDDEVEENNAADVSAGMPTICLPVGFQSCVPSIHITEFVALRSDKALEKIPYYCYSYVQRFCMYILLSNQRSKLYTPGLSCSIICTYV